MIIESKDVVFFEDIFPYTKEIRLLGEKNYEIPFRDEGPVNQQLMQKLNQEGVRDRESLNSLVQTS